MKIVTTILGIATLATAINALAQTAAPVQPIAGGAQAATGNAPIPYMPAYTGPSAVPMMSVAQVRSRAWDDQYVTLRGNIVQYMGDENYMFADSTGSIHVEIDHDKFPPGQQIGANTLVEISGEFDKEYLSHSKIDVKRLTILSH